MATSTIKNCHCWTVLIYHLIYLASGKKCSWHAANLKINIARGFYGPPLVVLLGLFFCIAYFTENLLSSSLKIYYLSF